MRILKKSLWFVGLWSVIFCLDMPVFDVARAYGQEKVIRFEIGSEDSDQQNSASLRPEPVPVEAIRGGGYALSWDGRLFIKTWVPEVCNDQQCPNGWWASLFRPEVLVGAESLQAIGQNENVFSPWTQLETIDQGRAFGFRYQNALAIVPDPSHERENPYRSDAEGNEAIGGEYETYRLLVITQNYHQINTFADDYGTTEFNDALPSCPSGTTDVPLGKCEDRLGRRMAKIVVAQPRTDQAAVHRAEFEFGDTAECLGGDKPPGCFHELTTEAGHRLRGIEPTLTFDGRLMIWQGHPRNTGWIGQLVYSFNPEPGALTGWSEPKSILAMYEAERDTVIDGIPFHELYPIAKEPLRRMDGSDFSDDDMYPAGYPWISLDGTELFHTTHRVASDSDHALRGGLAVIGRWTGYQVRHIDGPLNPDRDTTLRLFFSSPGAVPGLWAPYRDTPGVPIPHVRGRPVYPMFGSKVGNYGEVSFADHEDGDIMAALDMNEMLVLAHDGSNQYWEFDTARTPDTSGRGAPAALHGARFPEDVCLEDLCPWGFCPKEICPAVCPNGMETCEDSEKVCSAICGEAKRQCSSTHDGVGASQAIHFRGRDFLEVPNSGFKHEIREALTVELWVYREPEVFQDLQLVHLPGAWEFVLDADGKLRVTVHTESMDVHLEETQSTIPPEVWTHVAFSYEGSSNRLSLYQGGELLDRIVSMGAASSVEPSTCNLIYVGPKDAGPSLDVQIRLDEFKLSRVARTPEEIARSAYRPAVEPDILSPSDRRDALPFPMPSGLDTVDLRIPRAVSEAQITLGKQLFFDPRLSGDQTMACSTCHDPALGYSDGLPQAVGIGGVTLRRNTPSVINRAFSIVQMWDGRAETLESQVDIPIEHPEEMGLPLDLAVARVASVPEYVTAFQEAYGVLPNKDALRQALADYQRSLISGGSPVDRFEAGEDGALSLQASFGRRLFHGKARCVSCHFGANYTDESYHDSGFFHGPQADLGRGEFTRRTRDLGRFKTPTLRDLAFTAPYLHDGSAETLRHVLELYNAGGLNSAGDIAPGRDSEIRPLGLDPEEIDALVAFLCSLSGAEEGNSAGDLAVDRMPPVLPGGVAPGRAAPTAASFMNALYPDLLGRSADSGGLNFYVEQLEDGSKSRPIVVDEFMDSEEYLGRLVDAGFLNYLDRVPDPSGRAFYIDWLRLRKDLHAFWFELANSAEYHQRYVTDVEFITAIFQDILEREPGQEGLGWYRGVIERQGRSAVILNVLASAERRSLEWTRTYQEWLGREPTSFERESTETLFELRRTLTSCEEYYRRSAVRRTVSDRLRTGECAGD